MEQARAQATVGDDDDAEGQEGGECNPFVKRSSRRKQVRKEDQGKEDYDWSSTGLGNAAKRVEGKGRALSLTVSKQADARKASVERVAEFRASARVRAQIRKGDGQYLFMARITSGEEVPVIKIKEIVGWPEHGYDSNLEALLAMIDAVGT